MKTVLLHTRSQRVKNGPITEEYKTLGEEPVYDFSKTLQEKKQLKEMKYSYKVEQRNKG